MARDVTDPLTRWIGYKGGVLGGGSGNLVDDEELLRKLNALDQKLVRKALRKHIGKGLRPVVRTAKALCPKKSGALAATIRGRVYKVKSGDINGMVTAGGKVYHTVSKSGKTSLRLAKKRSQRQLSLDQGHRVVEYAAAVEYGRKRRRPYGERPFLRPAMGRHRDTVIKSVEDALREAVKEAFGN